MPHSAATKFQQSRCARSPAPERADRAETSFSRETIHDTVNHHHSETRMYCTYQASI